MLHKEKLDAEHKIISIVSVLLSIVALIAALYPQLIFGNDNLLSKANAGHAKSQMLLAEHYFEIGEYKDSIYWYKVASANKSRYQAVACNNLGYLYAKGYGLSENEIDGFYRQERAVRLFAEAYRIGLQSNYEYVIDTSRDNGLNTVRFYSEECFPNKEDYPGTILNWIDMAKSTRVVVSCKYVSFDVYKGRSFWIENTYYTFSGTCIAQNDNENFMYTHYKYFVQIYKPNTEPYNPVFIYMVDMNGK